MRSLAAFGGPEPVERAEYASLTANPGRYDDVGTYEYQMPEDYDDEEVEESEAFNSDDEALFGGTLAAIQVRI